jgi:predicted ATP-grasp superfamily ATP-dependent carboligase
MDLVRPLGRAGIPVAVAARPRDPVRYSRFVRARSDLPDEGPRATEALLEFAARQPLPPVLFFEDDWHLLLASRERERLLGPFRYVVAEADLIEDLMDKQRFNGLAERVGLPVPHARAAAPASEPVPDVALPVLLKPLPARNDRWRSVEPHRKALTVADRRELENAWRRLAAVEADVLVQELVPGPESRIESYHVYVDASGETAAEFSGGKIRTYPTAMGHSTALTITDAPDVIAAGRELVEKVGLTGVAKADYKRAPDGTLHLLEVNPRFNLWHHLAAVAGLNLPAIVYADCSGEPRPPVRRPRVGATWSLPWLDARSAREHGTSMRRWVRWVATADAHSVIALDDPLPFLAGKVWPAVAGRLGRG